MNFAIIGNGKGTDSLKIYNLQNCKIYFDYSGENAFFIVTIIS